MNSYRLLSSTFCLVLSLTSCTGGRHFEVVGEGPPRNAPKYVVVTKAAQIATLHFPAGTYRFYAVDDGGLYCYQSTGTGPRTCFRRIDPSQGRRFMFQRRVPRRSDRLSIAPVR